MVWKPKLDKIKTELKVSLFDSISLVNAQHWTQTNNNQNIYLSIPYLTAIENTLSGNLSFRYLQFYNTQNEPVGIAVLQILILKDNIKNHQEILCRVSDKVKEKFLNTVNLKFLICGNLFSCGENGFKFVDHINKKEKVDALINGLNRVKILENKKDNQISYYLLKEFYPASEAEVKYLKNHDFNDFSIDVNMVLTLNPNWKNFEEYLQDMTTKFRTKAKLAYKKSTNLRVEDLSHEQIKQHRPEITKLFNNVIERAEYNLTALNSNSFYELKKALHENIFFFGYFLKNQLVGFSFSTIKESTVEVNYVGIDYENNRQYAIYQRMLYDMVDFGIKNNLKEIRFGRTSEELKSTLGAIPVDMKLCIRHRNQLSNILVKPFINSISPSSFEFRNPYKVKLT